ncbi:MAG: hypothetical protein KatS3mg077_0336 [Candidatus Binatia bacterium]|nr:MAG: hypothetical protein KatS3mg077_0336 [Candidatus Binatia bacterium]
MERAKHGKTHAVAAKGWQLWLVLVTLAHATASFGTIILTDTESPIVNGLATGEYPAVGALLYSQTGSPSTAQGICSGTLIGCRTFITAAHCVCDGLGVDCQPGQPGAPNPNQYFVFLPHVGLLAVQSVAVRTDFELPSGDVAVLKLSTEAENIRPARINTATSPARGTPGTIVGYGLTGGARRDYGVKRYGSVTIADCGLGVSPQTSVCWQFRLPLGPPATNSNTCYGDSGGPLFIDFGSGPLLAGLTSGGTSDTCAPPDDSYDANVYWYRNWIAAASGADLDATACGRGPQIGDPEVTVLHYEGVLASQDSVSYEFEVPPQTSDLRVTSNATADFDLYVRTGTGVTLTSYDCKDDGVSAFATCRFAAPASGTWSALVYAYGGAGAHQITVTMVGVTCQGAPDGSPCDDRNECTENDQCVAGSCVGTPVANGTSCSDGNRCTNPDICINGSCIGGSEPRMTCKQVLAAGASVLRWAKPATRPASLVWRWSRGQATYASEFGEPRGSTDYDVCFYQQQGGQLALSWQSNIPAGGVCASGRACWTKTRKGFRYLDQGGSAQGITRLQLSSGDDGKATIVLKGGTASLSPPALPLQLPAKVQVVNDQNCWEADFSAPRRNTATEFRAHSGP